MLSPRPTLHELLVGELRENGRWLVASVIPETPWPNSTAKAVYRGRDVFIIPASYTLHEPSAIFTFPSVATRIQSDRERDDGMRSIAQFLSSLAWTRQRGISIHGWSGGNLPRPEGGFRGSPTTYPSEWYEPWLPEPTDPTATRALAFFREGMSINHVAYQSLSFFKVLNLFLPRGVDQIAWMSQSAPRLAGGDIQARLARLPPHQDGIGGHLYVTNRCAVAHSYQGQPVADPDDPADLQRLYNELPIIQALAEYAIESHFGIKTPDTVYREHLYELSGFKALIGQGIVDKLVAGDRVDAFDLPQITMRLVHQPICPPLVGMTARVVGTDGGVASLHCEGPGRHAVAVIGLDFVNERLLVEPGKFGCRDDGTAGAAYAASEILQFSRELLGNGRLEIVRTDSGQLLGRKDAYLPMNIDLQATSAQMDIEMKKITKLANERRDSG